ncbi:MAG TPA: molybdopterin molybdenumtransferase MoeA, partial [Paracoccaceae bacterium]|nr:molybdopterin molybdenumtransferase MoeA [Paracoccaceae bacterium]
MTVLKMVEACGCDAIAVQQKLENVDIALAKVLRLVKPVDGIETRPISQALNRVLAQPVLAAADMPRFDNSGMDGYAFRHCDLDDEMGLPVVGVCAAGSAPACLTPGTAMRIYTGAPVPLG